MSDSWEKVRNFLDTMDIQHLRYRLPSSFSSSSSSSSSSLSLSSLSSSSSSNYDQKSSSIDTRRWQLCERTAQQVLSIIQPDALSENRRKEIIEYLQGLMENAFGIKVYSFGSVPLKTYLPHGDIDLTAVSDSYAAEYLAAQICGLLENEGKNNTIIEVKDVLYVPAQVKVIKCTVGGISVDISVNQTAGLSALYFLDQVDRFIGQDHIFKRSVILIKAWCYYESRTLGGVYGLISTYALETMVLHVINLFHSSLHCPSAVLKKFLDYYSTFDWENYCIAFNGLVSISSLPEIAVQLPNDCDGDLALTAAFLKSSSETIASIVGVAEATNLPFPVKFMNIMDPLREENNLGRSVSKGNFRRIKSAFSFGAGKFSEMLMLPLEKVKNGLEFFFRNTIELNGKGRRHDVEAPVSVYGTEISTCNDETDHLHSGIQYGVWFHDFGLIAPAAPDTGANEQVWHNQWMEISHNVQFDQSVKYNTNKISPPYTSSPTHRSSPPYADSFRSPPFARATPGTEKWKSRGTGPFIPHLDHLLRRNMRVGANGVEQENEIEQEFGKVETMDSAAYALREMNLSDEGGNSDMFNFSIEEFPLLPGFNPIPIKVSQLSSIEPEQVSQLSSLEPEQVKDTSASLDSLEFDSFKQQSSPRSLSLSEVGKQSDSDVSAILDSVSDPVTIVTMPEDQESSKSKEQEVVPVQLPQLEDDKEFPPLSRPPEPVITLNKKEFPTLHASLKFNKKGSWKKGFK